MQVDILELFRRHPGEYLSGEDISRQLKVSRTAVWKHIRALKQQGYDIEAHTRLGYCLRRAPDRLSPAEVWPRLATRRLAQRADDIRYYASVDSTNNTAKTLAEAGCPEGTVVVAEEQSGGRGRLARGWFSPPGKGVWVSVVLRPAFAPQEAPKCTLMAAVAVNRAIRQVTGRECGIKWPNDILWQGKKLVGILTEMSAEMDIINHVVIGMGTNININEDEFPPEIRDVASSLSIVAGRSVSRLDFLVALLQELDRLYLQVLTGGFSPVLEEWRSQSITLGRMVDVLGQAGSFAGEAVDIDDEGALLVRTAQGVERVWAGDVSVRPAKQAGGNQNVHS